MKRKTYTNEFKQQAVNLALQSEQPLHLTARELGVSQSGLRKWIKAYEQPELPSANRNTEERLQELKKENRRLRMEREILKKSVAFFAREQL